MGERSKIEWTDNTFNPWWGCARISPACDYCYAATFAQRLGFSALWEGERREFGEKHWREPLKWNARAQRTGQRERVFCASMADVFDTDAPAGARERLWELIEATPALDWLLLTKRIGNAARMLPAAWLESPRPNVWMGATFCNQAEVERDLWKLLAVPAVIHFGSFEPLLGPVSLRWLPRWTCDGRPSALNPIGRTDHLDGLRGLDWVICGGESGPHARPMDPAWARTLRDQCVEAHVPFLLKQWGEWLPGEVFSKEIDGTVQGGFCRHQDGTEDVRRGTRDHWWSGDAFGGVLSSKVGKRVAGRRLDGRAWDEVPRVYAWPAPSGVDPADPSDLDRQLFCPV